MRQKRTEYKPMDLLAFKLTPKAVPMFNEFFRKGYTSTTVILNNCLTVADEIYRQEPEKFFSILNKNIDKQAE